MLDLQRVVASSSAFLGFGFSASTSNKYKTVKM